MVSYKTRVYTDMCINIKINSKQELVNYDSKLPKYGVLKALNGWGLSKHKFIYDWRRLSIQEQISRYKINDIG
jgi:hypothetical protein